MSQSFGGDWTQEKLARVGKYLNAYTHILSKKNFRFAYIDAFAGTGYNEIKDDDDQNQPMFQELTELEPQRFREGSASIALKTQPPFQTYIFIERDTRRFQELQVLKDNHLNLDIRLKNADANTFLIDLCRDSSWKAHRAVIFLDPFGMQVNWETIRAIADTKAVDLWYLFPLGIGVNRLLKRDGNIKPQWRTRLDEIFGDGDWYDEFYKPSPQTQLSLFDEEPAQSSKVVKTANWDAISAYLVQRLKTVFAHVAENPLQLYNSRRVPLYLLCFASTNATAVKIAKDVLKP